MRRFRSAGWLLLIACCLPLSAEEPVPWLGVQLGRIDESAAAGVPVTRVIEDSPAHKAGLRARDRIDGVDGQAVANNSELIRSIQGRGVGSWITLSVFRGDDERDLRVRLTSRPPAGQMRPRTGWIGIETIVLPPTLREHFGAPAEAGVMISEIDEGSPAAAAGFALGDVVYEIDGHPIGSPAELSMRVAGAGVGNKVEFLLTRWAQELVLEATVDSAPSKDSRP